MHLLTKGRETMRSLLTLTALGLLYTMLGCHHTKSHHCECAPGDPAPGVLVPMPPAGGALPPNGKPEPIPNLPREKAPPIAPNLET